VLDRRPHAAVRLTMPATADTRSRANSEPVWATVEVFRLPPRLTSKPAWMERLSPAERQRAERIGDRGLRDRYIVVRVALHDSLERNISPNATARTDTARCPACGRPSRKPTLEGTAAHVSLSHTAELVTIALSNVGVGIDVERRDTPRDLALAARWFTSSEQRLLADGAVRFRDLWARKEAVGKLVGVGIAHGALGTDVTRSRAQWRDRSCWLRDLKVADGTSCALATAAPVDTLRLESHDVP
jgi:phosphopantetheinyl transferase